MTSARWMGVLLLCAAQGATAQDAWKVSGQEQKPIYQTEWVRVRHVTHKPGETAPMHEHRQRVSVYLTDATVRLTAPDGKTQDVHYTPGMVKWSEPTKHSLTNIGKTPVEVVEVEFLAPRPATAMKYTGNPVEQDPGHFKLEFENERVRVYRYKLGPHEKAAMHDHLDRITVPLRDFRARATLPDGSASEVNAKAGEAGFRASTRHSVESLIDTPFEEISIEFKSPAN